MKNKSRLLIILSLIMFLAPFYNIVYGQLITGDYHITEIDDDGGTHRHLPNSFSENIIMSHGRYWLTGWEEGDGEKSGDVWIWNSTDKINWYGSELCNIADREVYLSSDSGYQWFYTSMDSNGDLFIVWLCEYSGGATNDYYIMKVTLEDDGSVSASTPDYCLTDSYQLRDLVVDSDDYPVIAWTRYYASGQYRLRITGSSTKDGTWVVDYNNLVETSQHWTPFPTIMPMPDRGIMTVWLEEINNNLWHYPYGRYFSYTDGFSDTFSIDANIRQIQLGQIAQRPQGLECVFGVNETYVSIYGREATPDTSFKLCAYRIYGSDMGNPTIEKKIIWDQGSTTTSERCGHITRMTSTEDIVVYYIHDDANEGNQTIYYSKINNDIIDTEFNGGTWTEENIELYTAELYDFYNEGCLSFGCSPSNQTVGMVLVVGKDDHTPYDEDCVHILEDVLFFEEEEEEPYPLPELLNVTIKGYDGDYIFEGEVYEIDSYWNNTHYCYFQLNDSVNTWKYYYYNESKYMGIDVIGFEGLKENEFIAGTIFTNYTYYNASGINQNVSRLQWRFILGVQVVDVFNRTLSYYGENFWQNTTSGDTSYTDISIYNLGGYVTYQFSGDAGHVIGGEAFELWAENATEATYAYSEKIFRKLQHYNGLVELYTEMDWQEIFPHQWQIEEVIGAGYVEYGFDFRYNQTWYEGWKCRILIHSGNIGHHGGGQDTAWIKLNVEWYYNDSLVSEDFIYSYHYSYFPENGNLSTRLSFAFFVDLWFNQENSSKVVGGRVTPFYLGVQERGWWGFGSFRPMYTDRVASSFATNLEVNNVSLSSKELEIIKCWCKLTKLSQNDKLWKLLPYTESHFKQASDRMMGVETPSYVEPKMPAIESQMGFLTGLKRSIENIANSIWLGALGFIKVLWGAMDSILSFMGFPEGTWSRITYFIMAIPNLLVLLISWIPLILDNMISLIGNMFGFLTITIGRFIWFLGHFATTWITWVTEIIDFFTGGFSGVRNLWELLDLEQWFMLFITIIFPMWWIERVWTSKNSLKQLQDDLKTFSGFYTGLFNFLKDMVILIRNLLGAIRSVLPI